MPRRLTNLLLLSLVVAQVATGLLGWAVPEARALPLYDLHRLLGAGLLLLLGWKQLIVRGSLDRRLRRRRRDGSVVAGVVTGLALLGCLVLGLAWTLNLLSFESFWGYSPLNLHVGLGLALLPLILAHLLRRWERRPAVGELLTRRSTLRLLGLSAGAIVSWSLLERAAEAWAATGSRRPSGSKHAGSFSGNDFPVTIWLFDSVPLLDPATWRLEIRGKLAAPGALTYDDLLVFARREAAAVIDCTGGWWSEQAWSGVPLADVLAARGLDPGAREISVVSVTGHRWPFPLDELPRLLLGTHVGSEVLTPAHGYPLRLVAPGRRGFQWVKWVGRIEVA